MKSDCMQKLSNASSPMARLSALRCALRDRQLDAFMMTLTDEHQSEYVAPYAQRIGWLTGFTGSTATIVVGLEACAFFVDGRYSAQAASEIPPTWSVEKAGSGQIAAWILDRQIKSLGYDPWLMSVSQYKELSDAMAGHDISLIASNGNPIDRLWNDQPARPSAAIIAHPLHLAGRSSADKRSVLAADLHDTGCDTLVLSSLDAVAWLFNIRGGDIPRTPVAQAFALIHQDGQAELFVDQRKLSASVVEHLGANVRILAYDTFLDHVSQLKGRRIALDPRQTSMAIMDQLRAAGAEPALEASAVERAKAIKTKAELGAIRSAHVRDGVALCRFLHWLSCQPLDGSVTESSVAAGLEAFRREDQSLTDLSFDTIVGAGSNAALPHYRPSVNWDQPLLHGSLLLVDSGGQYPGGTTDVTRTVSLGEPTEEMRDRYTRVLKGHIALAQAVFPEGTSGAALDVLARRPLWEFGLDYAHGTGHGVGAYLGVHEGPQRIHHTGGGAPLGAGMIVSNEPGYYKVGAYGIRIENLMEIVAVDLPDAEIAMLGFSTLTLAPLDRRLIRVNILSYEEIAWVDRYHARVARNIAPLVDGAALRWLREETMPLRSDG